MFTSRQSIRHSRRPSKLRSHSMPMPVHSSFACSSCSSAEPATVDTVEFNSCAAIVTVSWNSSIRGTVPLEGSVGDSEVEEGDEDRPPCWQDVQPPATSAPPAATTGTDRGSNQLFPKSKKQRSDQLQLVRKRIRRRNEQYTHGRLRKYVQAKKRKIKVGEAFVGIKRSGSQLDRVAIHDQSKKTPRRQQKLAGANVNRRIKLVPPPPLLF